MINSKRSNVYPVSIAVRNTEAKMATRKILTVDRFALGRADSSSSAAIEEPGVTSRHSLRLNVCPRIIESSIKLITGCDQSTTSGPQRR
jgi:hypothetical protein